MEIEIDFEVFKKLTNLRQSETDTYNDVMRRVLELGQRPVSADPSDPAGQPGGWDIKGIVLPAGTELRATYKGRTYLGKVQGGAFIVDGKRYKTPSAASFGVTESSVNGWRFWECRRPGEESWTLLDSLRKK